MPVATQCAGRRDRHVQRTMPSNSHQLTSSSGTYSPSTAQRLLWLRPISTTPMAANASKPRRSRGGAWSKKARNVRNNSGIDTNRLENTSHENQSPSISGRLTSQLALTTVLAMLVQPNQRYTASDGPRNTSPTAKASSPSDSVIHDSAAISSTCHQRRCR